jgi:NAD(P)-dependent dehydrogenase (short-subunit alcohol dehydrogenase family)
MCLYDVARLQRGERILIHAGTGGVRQMAIMMAQHIGAEVFTTCSTEEKRDRLIEHYNLDSDHILSSRDASFANAIMAQTGGAGVDVVINSLSGPLLLATWDCMARFGRFVEIGKVDCEAARRLDMSPFGRCAQMTGFDLLQLCTYMIVGGVGGIGNAIAEFMIEKGAKNILIVSHNAEFHPKAIPLIRKAKADGYHVFVRNCDISDEEDLLVLLADCRGRLPPIRGVIQAAMALDDTILESLTFEQWRRSIQPKVAGSLNLHNHFPVLKFFVMLSSIVGVVGHTSQSNYAAGKAFQDALARHRTANGLPAVATDLGAVGSVGVVAEANDNMLERVERNLGSQVIPIEKVLLLIEAAVREPFRKNPDQSQVITGILDYDRIPEDTSFKKDKRFGKLRLDNSSSAASESTKGAARSPDEVPKHVLTVTTPTSPEAANLVSDALVNKLASIFNIVAGEIEAGLGLSTLGVDSLVAVELRNWLSSVVQAKVTVFEIL